MLTSITFSYYNLFKTACFIVAMVWVSGCRKDEPGGSGSGVPGPMFLEVHAVHHSWDVAAITVYLKKNVSEFPGRDSSIYEFKAITDGYGKVEFEHLYPGNYYVYASGFDSIWGSNVIGHLPVTLNSETVTDNHASILLYVSE